MIRLMIIVVWMGVLVVSGGSGEAQGQAGKVIFMDSAAAEGGDGLSWGTAFRDLQDGLEAAGILTPPVEIWVAEGTYIPSQEGIRAQSFQMGSGIELFGGFPTKGGDGTFDARDPSVFVTTLSGDLLGNDGPDFQNNQENSFHVVIGTGADETGILDGFTVTSGNADGPIPDNRGGGMFTVFMDGFINSNPTVVDCIFKGNFAQNGGGMSFQTTDLVDFPGGSTVTRCIFTGNRAGTNGGGMHNEDINLFGFQSSPTILECQFLDNTAKGLPVSGGGGGMANISSNPTVTNCLFEGNRTETFSVGGGGGMYNDSSDPTISECVFSNNITGGSGGGMHNRNNSTPTILSCLVSQNECHFHGGGIVSMSGSVLTISNCVFDGNQAPDTGGGVSDMAENGSTSTNCVFSSNSASIGGGVYRTGVSGGTFTDCTFSTNIADFGGGIYIFQVSSTHFLRNTFIMNSAGAGGGMYCHTSSPVTMNCSFLGNNATIRGGGVYNFQGADPLFLNCEFVGNVAKITAGGIRNNEQSRPTIINCAFVENHASEGGGIGSLHGSHPTVLNSILWGNQVDQVFNAQGAFTTINQSLIQGGHPGSNNIDLNPLFTFLPDPGPDGLWGTEDDNYGDLRLQPISPGIDAGDTLALPLDESDLDHDGDTQEPIPFDLDGLPRVVGTSVDMGAYEFQGGLLALLDIEPGECPNTFKPRFGNSNRQIKVAMVGTAEVVVNQVDVSTILLARADGIGGAVLPSGVRIKDRATPFIGDPCGCHELKKDGAADSMMRFVAADMTAILELANLPEGAQVELVISGTLFDGTPFSARDCITIESPSDND